MIESAMLRALVIVGMLAVGAQAAEPTPAEPAKDAAPVVTESEVTIGGEVVRYRATVGTLPIKDDVPGAKPKAEVFYIAYEKLGVEDVSRRPILFAFNGGPGSSSVWLHLGALGPKRVEFGDDGERPAPPGRLIDNETSWLDLADLVFIDPVSTGFSRAAEGQDAKQFHGLDEDAAAVGEFIRLYTSRAGRWASPKFLAGESYGTTRAAALSDRLQSTLGMELSGVILISPVLNFATLRFDAGNDLPYALYVPAYAATAWYHGKLTGEEKGSVEDAVERAQAWAMTDYLVALAKGDGLVGAERERIAARLASFTGLSREFVLRSDVRVEIQQFCKELLRGEGKTVGRLDSRYTATEGNATLPTPSFDSSYATIQGPFTAALNAYLRGPLRYTTDLNYEILTGKVGPWNFGDARNRYANVADDLRRAMTTNPRLRVLVACGYYDLATPPSAATYTMEHLGLDERLRGNITTTFYEAGHMMYLRKADRDKLKADTAAFFAAALGDGGTSEE